MSEFSLEKFIHRQSKFCYENFGPGDRMKALLAHLRKELVEVEEAENPLTEWVDVIILALEGCIRTGATAHLITQELEYKMTRNENRIWPDWHSIPKGQPIEHDRSNE